MNGLYSEAALEPEVHQWNPGIGYQSAGPKDSAEIEAASKQRVVLDGLAAMSDMAKRVEAIVDGYEDYADNIQEAHNELYDVAEENDFLVAGVPEWWRSEVHTQRILREALISSLRDTAKKIADTYGVR